VKGPLNSLPGENENGDQVDEDPDQGNAETDRTIQPILKSEKI
jgi:hypothetical protein